MMAEEKDQLTRRDALKTIGVGVGVIASLPVLNNGAVAQEHNHANLSTPAVAAAKLPINFFTED